MKAAYLSDVSVNPNNAPDAHRNSLRPVFHQDSIVDWILPKGHILEGDEALFRVRTGQAAPLDKECADACGMNSAQLEAAQRLNLSALAGIKGKKDEELFMAGVIDGYLPGTTDAKPIYKPGKNWEAFQQVKEEAAAESAGKVAI